MRHVLQLRWQRLATVLAGCAVIASCSSVVDSLASDDRPSPNDVQEVPVRAEAVVGALLSRIDGNGLFRYPMPNVGPGEMPFDTALAQAVAFLDYAQNTGWRLFAESQRGAFIEMGKLRPCGQVQLLRSKYEPPPDSVTRVNQILLGDRWSIPFCFKTSEREVVVTIATRANTTRFQNGKAFGPPADEAAAFVVRGLPWGWGSEHMVTPEEAVNEVFDVTGIRVAQLPEIVHGHYVAVESIDGRQLIPGAYCAAWRVVLERGASLTTRYTGRQRDLTELYVADSDCPGVVGQTLIITPLAQQPKTREFRAWTGERSQVYTARFRAPVDFETVIIGR